MTTQTTPRYEEKANLLDPGTMQTERQKEEAALDDAALDDALRNTFPASDPVSIQTIYRPVRNTRPVLTLRSASTVAKPVIKPDKGA